MELLIIWREEICNDGTRTIYKKVALDGGTCLTYYGPRQAY